MANTSTIIRKQSTQTDITADIIDMLTVKDIHLVSSEYQDLDWERRFTKRYARPDLFPPMKTGEDPVHKFLLHMIFAHWKVSAIPVTKKTRNTVGVTVEGSQGLHRATGYDGPHIVTISDGKGNPIYPRSGNTLV